MRGRCNGCFINHCVWGVLLCATLLISCATPHTLTPYTPTPLRVSTPSISPSPTPISAIATKDIRQPAVAGMFYPADATALQTMVDQLLQQAKQVPQEPLALIVPHAGYVYSGAVAASAFKQLEGRKYDAIVVIGGNHHDPYFTRISVWPSGAYSTPIGLMPVDSALAEAIVAADPQRIIADRRSQLSEHSIEVELPFLLRAYGPAPFVPVLMGQQSWENCQALSAALLTALQGKKALIIASTDMSHYPSYDEAVQVDRATLLAITSLDPQAVISNTSHWLSKGVDNLYCTLCGEGAVLTAMLVAQKLGANRSIILHYANSGDSPYGNKDQVVGYGAIMFWKEEATMSMLNEEEKATLLRIARETLQHYLSHGTMTQYEVSSPGLLQHSGAFVTLKKKGQLRGCIGHMTSNQELYRTVQEMAIAAAVEDPRFPPVKANELADIEIEISVLSPLYLVQDVNEIQIGRDGLYIIRGPYAGVLLPQVATEWGWDREEFLREVCLKAGLPPDAWQEGAILYRFEAQVFGEKG